MNIFQEKLSEVSHEDWLKLRTKGIGGSDVAGIMGISKWKSPLDIFHSKTKPTFEKISNFAIEMGNDLEPMILQKFEEATGYDVHKPDVMYQHPEIPYMLANLDGWIESEKAIVECKAVTARGDARYESGTPDEYYAQVQHYMYVMGAKKAYLAHFHVSEWKLKITEIPYDEAFIEQMLAAEEEFWMAVELGIPPGLTKLDEEPVAQRPEAHYISELDKVIDEYNKALNEKKRAHRQSELLKNRLMGYTKSFGAVKGDKYKLNATMIAGSTRFDSKRFKEENPDVYAQYTKQSKGYSKLHVSSL